MSTGNFFRVDRRSWAAVCELGMSPAVAYLVLAQGTDGNNRLTKFSAARYSFLRRSSWSTVPVIYASMRAQIIPEPP